MPRPQKSPASPLGRTRTNTLSLLTSPRLQCALIIAILIGAALRLGLATLGFNYDLQSYRIVSDIVLNGGSVYAETSRYNYGPLWYFILGALRRLVQLFAVDNLTNLHLAVAGFLTAVDATLTVILARRFGLTAAVFFILNPISLLVTGYHSQFDNLAILIGVLGCGVLDGTMTASPRRRIAGLALIGVSLAMKHILFFFPVWLFFRESGASRRRRMECLLIPYAIFFGSFLLARWDYATLHGISDHVFSYASAHGRGVLSKLLGLISITPAFERESGFAVSRGIFVGCLAAVGWIWAGRSKGESSVLLSLLTYLTALTALSTSMADQYLAIPLIAAAACCRSPAAMVYTLLGGAILLESHNNVMRLTPPESTFIKYYHAQIALLFLLGWMFRSPRSEALRAVERGEAPRPLTGTP